jgi:hypothetical protein
MEYKLMHQVLQNGATSQYILPVAEGSYRRSARRYNGVPYAGYIMGVVGTGFQRSLRQQDKENLAAALFALHAAGFVHGDPRIDNAVLVGEQVKWIDLREAVSVTTEANMRIDVEIFLESLAISPDDDAVDDYVTAITADKLRAMV